MVAEDAAGNAVGRLGRGVRRVAAGFDGAVGVGELAGGRGDRERLGRRSARARRTTWAWPACSSSSTAPTSASEDTSAPYSVTWDTTAATAGPHALTAVARDAAGNRTTSAAVSVTVDNSVPAGPAPVAAYDFEEASGGSVTDVTGKGHTGTIREAIAHDDGQERSRACGSTASTTGCRSPTPTIST